MNRKGFLAVLLALATSLTMLTACGSDDPEPEVKPSAGYFTYYLLTNAETLNAMQITNTLYTNEEVKTGIITADKCITLAEVTDPVAKAVLQNGLKSFGDKSNVLVYRAKFNQQSQPIVSLTYGLNFVPKTLDASTPEPNLGYGLPTRARPPAIQACSTSPKPFARIASNSMPTFRTASTSTAPR